MVGSPDGPARGAGTRPGRGPAGARAWRHHPLARRIGGYSAGSVIAAVVSELAFAAAYGPGHAGTTWSSAVGFVGGAIPNYVLNRRWAWKDRRGRDRRVEILLYAAVALASFVASAVGTHWAEEGARHLTTDRVWRVVMVAGAYLGVSAVFFVLKFVVYELVVFTRGGPAPASRPSVDSTTS